MEQSDSEKNLRLEIKNLKEEITSLKEEIKRLNTPDGYSSYYWDNKKQYATSLCESIFGFQENDKNPDSLHDLEMMMFEVQKVQRMRVFSPVWAFAVPDEASPSGIKCLYFDSHAEARTEAKTRMREAREKEKAEAKKRRKEAREKEKAEKLARSERNEGL